MYLPRTQIAQLYLDLIRSTHLSSSPVLILTNLNVDSLCATRILVSLLKQDFITHTIVPITGYADLQRAGAELVVPLTRQRGGDGGTVVCLGLGGTVALESILGLLGNGEDGEEQTLEEHGVEVWVVDSHRPLNLENVFGSAATMRQDDGTPVVRAGVTEGRITNGYKPGKGGVIVWDDGDLDSELAAEKEAYFALQGMPEITEEDLALDDGNDDAEEDDADQDNDETASVGQKRKRRPSVGGSDADSDYESNDNDDRPPRRRRSNSSISIPIPSSPGGNPLSAQIEVGSTPPIMPSSPPRQRELTAKQMRKQLLRMRRKHEATLDKYYDLGTSAAEPVSSMLYSLASELGRDDNELLWLAIVGLISITASSGKLKLVRALLQDEVTRHNPIPAAELQRSQSTDGGIPTTARNATDNSIRLSPEPRLLLTRHWSLYDSMMHSPYLATRLHIWSDAGRKRLNKLLAKMGISISESMKGYLHMDSELKRTLRQRLLKFAEQYNLDGLVPGDNGANGKEGWGFVRSWGWSGTLSAEDVAIVVAAILEVGTDSNLFQDVKFNGRRPDPTYNTRVRNLPTPPHSSDDGLGDDVGASDIPDYVTQRFFRAYDALEPSSSKGLRTLQQSIPAAQKLYKAILRLGSAIISKKMIRHLRSFRMACIKEGPDVPMFLHPGALVRLAAWVGEAVAVLESEKGHKPGKRSDQALVLAALDEGRNVYIVVALGGGSGWSSTGKVRSKAEIKEREERKKRKAAEKAAQRAERTRKREERRRLRKERNAANGLDSDDEDFDESEADTETVSSDDSDSESDSDGEDESSDKKKQRGLNRFGQAFQEVVEETAARVRIDSFEHSVVEVQKEDLSGFLEALSMKTVVS